MKRLSGMAVRTKRMISAVTGKLTTYELVRHMDAYSRFTADMQQLKTGIQDQFTARAVDAFVESCAQIRETKYDYLITDVWEPAESPIAPIIVAAVIFIIKWVVTATIIGIIIVSVASALHDKLYPPEKHYCDICGEEFPSITALTAHRRMAHPGVPPYQCPYCGMAFNTAEELNAHVAECPLKPPPGLPEWIFWILVAAGVIIGGIIVYKVVEKVR